MSAQTAPLAKQNHVFDMLAWPEPRGPFDNEISIGASVEQQAACYELNNFQFEVVGNTGFYDFAMAGFFDNPFTHVFHDSFVPSLPNTLSYTVYLSFWSCELGDVEDERSDTVVPEAFYPAGAQLEAITPGTPNCGGAAVCMTPFLDIHYWQLYSQWPSFKFTQAIWTDENVELGDHTCSPVSFGTSPGSSNYAGVFTDQVGQCCWMEDPYPRSPCCDDTSCQWEIHREFIAGGYTVSYNDVIGGCGTYYIIEW